MSVQTSLDIVYDTEDGLVLQNSIDFAGDSVMCEWAYVIDLDKATFEVFRGFNKSPLEPSERFANAPTEGEEYFPVRLFASWSLSKLPTWREFEKQVDVLLLEEEA